MSQITAAVRRTIALSMIAATGAALVTPVKVHAQESAGLEEIIVTAERRSMALQDTPISIVAITGESLESKGVDDLMDLSDFSPNLSIKGGRTGGNNAPVFSIRGIGGGGGASGERGVALYIDGIYVPRTSGSVFRVFDIDRAEVLRGPQGTLFGRNSEGGAIRIFTKQPEHSFDAYVRGTYGNFDHKDLSGMVNIPVGDKLAVRAQAAYLERGRLHHARHAGARRQHDQARSPAAAPTTSRTRSSSPSAVSTPTRRATARRRTSSASTCEVSTRTTRCSAQGNYARLAARCAGARRSAAARRAQRSARGARQPPHAGLLLHRRLQSRLGQRLRAAGRQQVLAGRREPEVGHQRRPAVHVHHGLLAPGSRLAVRCGAAGLQRGAGLRRHRSRCTRNSSSTRSCSAARSTSSPA